MLRKHRVHFRPTDDSAFSSATTTTTSFSTHLPATAAGPDNPLVFPTFPQGLGSGPTDSVRTRQFFQAGTHTNEMEKKTWLQVVITAPLT